MAYVLSTRSSLSRTMLASAAALALLAMAIAVMPTGTAIGLIGLGLGVPLVWLLWYHPELGMALFIFLNAGLVPYNAIDIRLPIGGLKTDDLVLLGMVTLLVVRGLVRRSLSLPWWPVSAPLLAFLVCAVLSVVYAISYNGANAATTLNEARPLIKYTTFFVTVWALQRPKQLTWLLMGLFIIADLAAAVQMLQEAAGRAIPFLAAMRTDGWALFQEGVSNGGFGTIRVVPPAHTLIYMMSLIALVLMVGANRSPRQRVFFALQLGYLNVALLFTYTRAQWVASAIAIVLIMILAPLSDKLRLARSAALALLLVLAVYVTFGSELQDRLSQLPAVQSLTTRMSSLLDPRQTLASDSLEWRLYENGEALRSIQEHPLFGVGIGNAYRNPTLLHYEVRRGRLNFLGYVHNNYLFTAVKMGLLGLGLFVWFCLAFLVNGYRYYRLLGVSHLLRVSPRVLQATARCSPPRATGSYQRVTLAILAGFVGLLQWSVTSPLFWESENAAAITLMIGIVAAMQNLQTASDTGLQE